MNGIIKLVPIKIIIITIALVGALAVSLKSSLRTANFERMKRDQYKKDEVIVKFSKKASAVNARNRAYSIGRSFRELRKSGHFLIKLDGKKKVGDVIESLRNDPDVEYVQPNYIYRIMAAPNDPEFGQLWGLGNTGQKINTGSYSAHNPGTAGSDMDAMKAWDEITDCSGVTVAVVDTGINYNHDDLAANMWDGSACKDEKGNPLGGCIHGYNFFSGTRDPEDQNGHGTHVSGTIGAVGNNGTGTAGICWNVKIMAVRVTDALGYTDSATISRGIDFAVQNGARVINLSLGGPLDPLSPGDLNLYEALERSKAAGAVAVAAAGNEGRDNDSVKTVPCDFKMANQFFISGKWVKKSGLDNLICVAALDQNFSMASFTNYGTESVDLGAPGTNIVSEWFATTRTITDDFNDSGAFDWISGAPLEWGYVRHMGMDCLANPFSFDWYWSIYQSNLDSMAYKTFALAGTENAVKLQFASKFEVESGYDYFEICFDNKSGYPEHVLDMWTGKTPGDNFYLFEYDLSHCAGSNACTVGFKLFSDSVSAYRGVAVTYFNLICDTYNNTGYNTVHGTSMAAPHVSGLAAILFAYNPDYTGRDVVGSIKGGGKPVSSLSGNTITGKAANAFGSVCFINPPEGVIATAVE
ncbi:MAG: S8 family serine peptidase [Spirochaetes bacterium]|jgi:subtilisin family serine protease|nr:S8 family serine peptidase [Spirochaetota bacterium]